MISKRFALIGGLLIMTIGLLALIPNLSVYNQSLPELKIETSYGYFLGIFAMNIFNKVALILIGLAGMVCSSLLKGNDELEITSPTFHESMPDLGVHDPSIIWSRTLLYVSGTLAILGMFEQTSTLGGYWPLFGAEVWFHVVLALCGGFFGYVAYEIPSQGSTGKLHKV